MGGLSSPETRAAEMSSFQHGRRGGFFGGGSLGLGGGMSNPTLLLTAPLLEGGSGQTAPPSPSVFSSSAVQQAFQTLQTDLKSDLPNGSKPTHASVGALQDDLDAIRQGTLSGTAAQTKIQADQAAILSSAGLTQAQITQIQSDQQALQTTITTASTSASTSAASSGTASTSTTTTTPMAPSSAVQTAFQTLQTDLKTDTPSSGSTISHAAIGTVQDDLNAIRNGTLTGTAAVTQVQTDAAAVLSSQGFTAAQVSQVQADQQALAAAIAADPNQPASDSSSSTATQATLQSVSEYLVGVPGVSSFGMRGISGFGMGPGAGPRGGGFMTWR
jgi:trimeric autotransporter adhesin